MNITGIVVLGVGGGVGQSILKCLAESPYRVIGVDGLPDATGLHWVARGYVGEFARSEDFIPRLLDICIRENANVVFPGLDAELIPLAAHRDTFRQRGIELVVSSESVIQTAHDKYLTAAFLREHGFCAPRTELERWHGMDFPVIVKPRFGGARSVGCHVCHDEAELEQALAQNENFIIQEYIDGPEYTCGTVNLGGRCYGCIPMLRTLRAGDTYKAYATRQPAIEAHVRRVVEALGPHGPCNVQLRIRNGECYVFEINARCSGTSAARALAGFNDVLWMSETLETGTPRELDFREVAVFRHWAETIVEPSKLAGLQATGSIQNRGLERREKAPSFDGTGS